LGVGSPTFYRFSLYGNEPEAGTYPSDWPLMNRWYDGFNVQTEFTTGPLARETVVAAYFAKPDSRRVARPRVQIVADRRAISSSVEVKFRIQAVTPGGRVRQVFWDFDDESFSTDQSPTHHFASASKAYTVAVTIIDDQGVSAFDTIQISTR
jgi:hypothetical protein